MSKRTVFTTITPLPPDISREVAVDFLHNHLEMIDLNPLVTERHPIPPPAHASPEEARCVWYSLTDRISYLPGGRASGSVSYTCAFHNLPIGLQTHCYAPMGLDIRDKWSVAGSLPGEPKQPAELGIGAPIVGLYIREDVDMRCNILMTPFVKKTLKRAHASLVEHLKLKAQLASSSAVFAGTFTGNGVAPGAGVVMPGVGAAPDAGNGAGAALDAGGAAFVSRSSTISSTTAGNTGTPSPERFSSPEPPRPLRSASSWKMVPSPQPPPEKSGLDVVVTSSPPAATNFRDSAPYRPGYSSEWAPPPYQLSPPLLDPRGPATNAAQGRQSPPRLSHSPPGHRRVVSACSSVRSHDGDADAGARNPHHPPHPHPGGYVGAGGPAAAPRDGGPLDESYYPAPLRISRSASPPWAEKPMPPLPGEEAATGGGGNKEYTPYRPATGKGTPVPGPGGYLAELE